MTTRIKYTNAVRPRAADQSWKVGGTRVDVGDVAEVSDAEADALVENLPGSFEKFEPGATRKPSKKSTKKKASNRQGRVGRTTSITADNDD